MGADRFIERMGRHLEGDGLPRIGGRMLGLLLLHDEPLSLDDMAERLRVSKTSISTNARLLETLSLAQRVSRPGDRRDFYVVTAEPEPILELRLQRLRDFEAAVASGLDAVPPGKPGLRTRLARLRSANTRAYTMLSGLVERGRPAPAGVGLGPRH